MMLQARSTAAVARAARPRASIAPLARRVSLL